MRTAYEIVRRIAETAMSRHGLDARKLASAAGRSDRTGRGDEMNQTRNERKQRAQELMWIALVTAFLFGVFALGMSVGIWLTEVA